jgi:putative ABC transport system permease protein
MLELLQHLSGSLAMGVAQAAGAVALCLIVVLLCRFNTVHIGREAAISIARGLVQMVSVGIVLALLLHGPLLIGLVILLLMMIAASVTASRRAQSMKSSVIIAFWAIAAGPESLLRQ